MSNQERMPAIRVMMMPRDTNAHGTIFGGVILSHIDQAGAVAAIEAGFGKVVTVTMNQVVFHHPVRVGDLVSFYAEIVKTGRTSVCVQVEVEAFRRGDGTTVQVTQADVTYVHINDQGQPIPVP